ncbi:MAG: undecaprenyldiphospho-muramoylpentapeptide beta-N-acetylglucosaminyltransferase [Treponema sp.]|nr:undecaprenyldiphospho-muramoylpentapeptide beta-N-acetylglucosaminyltransferase [Treponema sp.]
MKLNKNSVVFTGGGTGGHIYPGLAVADELKELLPDVKITWIGCSTGMDRRIVEKARSSNGSPTADAFYGIPSGKLRRYFSFKNFTDLFRIMGGFFSSLHILRKVKPAVLFSKGGFVSVPPCIAAKMLKIPVYTHECDFTLGLANRINFKSAKKMFVSYEETKNRIAEKLRSKIIVSGNPVRPVFYQTDVPRGMDFLGIKDNSKPILLVLGGSSGAKQINDLVSQNLDWLCENFVVIHQTGLLNGNEAIEKQLQLRYGGNYKPYPFIYEQMPDVLACADVILSRAGANSIWEAAVLEKPMVLIPLCGSGTRGDQVDNARFFEEKKAADILVGSDADSDHLIAALTKMLDKNTRAEYTENLKKLTGTQKPAKKIAEIIADELK